jgi:hypothetical protein
LWNGKRVKAGRSFMSARLLEFRMKIEPIMPAAPKAKYFADLDAKR